ncbi:hypothetical protein [Komagataeibacter swingsii]|uniref:hypothetical protein n=1 Tax=Komagataeibacter swingsii TaxID=215220 RepID=UPI00142DAC9D|nr:hypothetical protein [Komagataeibacter swingsii]
MVRLAGTADTRWAGRPRARHDDLARAVDEQGRGHVPVRRDDDLAAWNRPAPEYLE